MLMCTNKTVMSHYLLSIASLETLLDDDISYGKFVTIKQPFIKKWTNQLIFRSNILKNNSMEMHA
jgi:hypothetical protein